MKRFAQGRGFVKRFAQECRSQALPARMRLQFELKKAEESEKPDRPRPYPTPVEVREVVESDEAVVGDVAGTVRLLRDETPDQLPVLREIVQSKFGLQCVQ